MTEPKISPFKLTQGRIILLIFGLMALLIGISTALGGLSSYQQLREASMDAQIPAAAPADAPPAQ